MSRQIDFLFFSLLFFLFFLLHILMFNFFLIVSSPSNYKLSMKNHLREFSPSETHEADQVGRCRISMPVLFIFLYFIFFSLIVSELLFL